MVMASQQISEGFWDKVQAQLQEDAQKRADEQRALWDKTRPKRELESYLMEKLMKDDKVAQKLMEEAQKISLELSKKPLSIPSQVHKSATTTDDFAPTTVLSSPFRLEVWKSSPTIEVSSDTSGRVMAWSLTTGFGGGPGQSVTSRLFSRDQVQPPPGSHRMTVAAQPDLDYSFGNHAAGYSRTHSWIGIFVQEWDFSGRLVRTNVNQQIDLWDLQSNHDFAGRSRPPLQAVNIPIVDNHVYVIAIQCSGAVEAPRGISYASLSVTLDAINVNFA